jgi:uncharacterized membrane protein (UPF0136 family)
VRALPDALLRARTHSRARTAASAILLLSSLPRVMKGPVPLVLATTAGANGYYYVKTLQGLRG